MNIEEAIYSYLTVHPTVSELAGVRGYPMTIPQTAQMPCYAYQVISQTEIMDHDGESKLFTTRVQFTCQAGSYGESKELARAIAKVLRGRKGLMGDLWVESGEVLNEFDGYGAVGGVYTTRVDVGLMYRKYGNVAGAAVADVVYDWYVDSVNGSDSYEGNSAARPFATIAKLLTQSISAGQSIALAKGSTWREQLTVPASSVTVVAYGSGADPILDCRDAATAGQWSKTIGQTNVYQITPTVDYLVAYGAFNSVWEDDVRLPLAASLAACDGAAGSYYVATHATTTPTIYVHATGSGNPASNGKTYEYAKRNFGAFSTYTNVGLNGLDCRGNLSESGSIRVGRSSIVIDCYAREGNKHNFFYADGCYLDGVQALDAYFDGSMSLFVYNENTPVSLGLTHIDCIADADTDGSTYVAGSSGFYGHRNTSGDFGAVTFSGCQARHCYVGFEGDSVASFSYANCVGTNCYHVFAARSSTPIVYTFASCVQTVADALTFSVIFNDTLDGHTFNVTSCNWNFTGFAGGGGAIYSAAKDMTVNLNGNTITIGTSWKSAVIALDGGAVTLYARNNSYQRTGAVTLVIYTLLDAASTVDSDYNTFGSGANMQMNIPAGNYSTIALYQAGTGQDAHSVVG